MIAEAFVISLLAFSGALLLRVAGFRSWLLLPIGFLIGVSLNVLFSYLLIITGLKISIFFSLVFIFLISLTCWLFYLSRGFDVKIKRSAVLLSLAFIALFTAFFYTFNLVRFHADSLNFLIIGNLLFENELDALTTYSIRTRVSSVPIIHSFAGLSENLYLRSFSPFLSLSTLTIIVWGLFNGFKGIVSKRIVRFYSLIAVLLLLTSHAYIFHSFYLNGHLLIAAYSLLAAISGWLFINQRALNRNQFLIIAGLSLAGLIFTRVEGFIYAGLVLLPLLTTRRIDAEIKKILILTVGLAIFVQQTVKAVLLGGLDGEAYQEIFPLMIFAVALIVTSAFAEVIARINFIYSKKFLVSIEAGIWAVLAIFVFNKPEIFINSVKATAINVALYPVPWGIYALALGVFFVVTLIFFRFKDQILLRLPITAFVPSVFIIAYLREAAFRVSYADSLNRMLIQIVPLIVLYIIIAVMSSNTRYGIDAPKVLRRTIDSLKSVNPLIWLVFAAIAVNTYQFTGVKEASGSRWAALKAVEDAEILNHENAKKYGSFYQHLSLFFTLGDIAPQSNLVLTTTEPFVLRGGPISFLTVPGDIARFKCTKADLTDFIGTKIDDIEEFKAAEGGYWASAGRYRKRHIYPGTDWSIYLSNNFSGTLVFAQNDSESEWYFIDENLLPNKLDTYKCL